VFVLSDGMPIYEGSEKVWQKYKAKLEKESHKLVGTFSVKNPVAELHELFPDSTYKFKDDKVDIGEFYQCKITVNGEEYEGLGRNKKDAKANAATNALEGLRVSGFLDQHMKELEAKKQAKVEKLKEFEKSDGSGKGKDRLEKLFNVSAAPAKNAVSKLNEIFPSIEYKIVGEMPVKNTCMTAFAVSVQVNRRTYTGIGKNKKLAKMAAAEKALRGLGLWTEDDEYMKVYALRGDRQLEETLENQMWRGSAPVRGGGRGKQGFSFGPVRGGRGAARGGFGFGGRSGR
jgi:dsRNA-specific ribonuclease